jgi:hypothetical protein
MELSTFFLGISVVQEMLTCGDEYTIRENS